MPGMPLRGDRIHRYVAAFCPHCHDDEPHRPLNEVPRLAGYLAERDGRILGVLELLVTDQGFLLDSIAVDPSAQGAGIGRRLLLFAEDEAKRQGFESIYLMTNEKMTENQELYARIGYVLFDRQTVHGYSRVLMRKPLV